jgi:uncharacterized protein (UPF0264 family)
MTKMLASVLNQREMALAMDAGCDIIDLKNPHAGALGALSYETIRKLTSFADGQYPVSATVGDLPADPQQMVQAVRQTGECGVDYVKIGFFTEHNLQACLEAVAELSQTYSLVAVLFADRAPMLTRLSLFAEAGFKGVMLDTAGKGGGGLLDHIDLLSLGEFVEQAHDQGMFCGLAGSLRLEDIPQLLPMGADYLGFRGALCEQGERRAGVVAQRLQAVREAVAVNPQSHTQSILQQESNP